jgi:hypothetical protein
MSHSTIVKKMEGGYYVFLKASKTSEYAEYVHKYLEDEKKAVEDYSKFIAFIESKDDKQKEAFIEIIEYIREEEVDHVEKLYEFLEELDEEHDYAQADKPIMGPFESEEAAKQAADEYEYGRSKGDIKG